MLGCSWKAHFGVDCLTCGFQRSVELLLNGEFAASFKMFPPTVPFIFCVLFLILHLFLEIKNGHKVIVTLFSVTAALIVVNYVVKLVNGTII